VNVDGSGETRLTGVDGYDGSPAWSNDGTIYFYSERSGRPQIWRMDSDGSNQELLLESDVALSPTVMNAERIAFAVADSVESNTWQMMSVKLDGSDLRAELKSDQDCRGPEVHPVTGEIFCYGTVDRDADSAQYSETSLSFAAGQSGAFDLPDRKIQVRALHQHIPEFSPDGKEILSGFVVTDDGPIRTRLVSAPIAGGDGRELHSPKEMEFQLGVGWAADRIVFNRGGPGFEPMTGPGDVWAMRSDGTGLLNLTPEPNTNDGWPDIANSGRVVFRTGRDNNFEIYAVDADGSNLLRLTNHPGSDTMPAISLDGRKVVFSSERDATFIHNFDLYLVDLAPDGQPDSLRRLTETKGNDMHAEFSPDGKWIVYTAQRGGRNDELYIWIQAGQTYGEIYAQRLSDGYVVRLTHNKWEDGLPAWGPATSMADPSTAHR
jgi:dipeptidyl aminopeptidase/acylaminoacyl peptidase